MSSLAAAETDHHLARGGPAVQRQRVDVTADLLAQQVDPDVHAAGQGADQRLGGVEAGGVRYAGRAEDGELAAERIAQMPARHADARAAIAERHAAVGGEAEEALAGIGGAEREQVATEQQVRSARGQRGAIAAGGGKAVIVDPGGDGEPLRRGRVHHDVGRSGLGPGGKLIGHVDPGDLGDEQRRALDRAVADRARSRTVATRARAQVLRQRLQDLRVGHARPVGAQPHLADLSLDHRDRDAVAAQLLGRKKGARNHIAATAVEAGHRARHLVHLFEAEVAVQPGRHRAGQIGDRHSSGTHETDRIDPGRDRARRADFRRSRRCLRTCRGPKAPQNKQHSK